MPLLPVPLPVGFQPTVIQGDKVKAGQIIAKKPALREVAINISDQLNIPAHKAFHYVKKNPGDSFVKGEILAVKKNLFGGVTAKVVSKTTGRVTRLERNTGDLFLIPETIANDTQQPEETVISPIEGIIGLCNNDKILIDTNKNFLQGIKGSGGSNLAKILILPDADTVEQYHLSASAIGKIVVGNYFPRDVLAKSVSIGISAVIGTKILDTDIAYLLERKMQLPIIEMVNKDLEKVRTWQGKKAFVDGEGKIVILLQN
jgi:hypothetical protein